MMIIIYVCGVFFSFDPEIPRGRCLSSESARPLRQGRTVFFAVQPKYLNVDIRIYVDVSAGGIDLYISDQVVTLVQKYSVINSELQYFG